MTKPVVYAITFFVCLLLQIGVAPAIAIGDASPNFLLIPVVLVALRSGYASASASGFACGLVEDFAGDGTIGCMALTMTLVGLVVGLVGSAVDAKPPLVTCVLVVCACLFAELVYGISVVLASADTGGVLATVVGHALPSAVYSALFGCVALVTINLVMEDDAVPAGRLGGSFSASARQMPRMKSRLK